MTFAPTQTVGKYEFLSIIDKPKAGITYKVRNRTTSELEVLRALPGLTSTDSESVERFLREIRVHTRLSHPNVVAFHDAFELDGQLVMTSEFVTGESLGDASRRGALPPTEAVRAICAVLSGLEEAHALGIVHRGITAEHVTLTAQGGVKLGGFGLAKPVSDVNLTQTGAILGDPTYISPEQITGASTDARADIYSVGVLLYLALTGVAPFHGPNEFEVMAAHLDHAPVPPSSLNPAISPELDRIVQTALAKRPEERYPAASAFRLALESALNRLPKVEPAVGPRSRKTMWVAVVAVAIVLAVIFFVAIH
jgi:serine/threonine-protein kinase